MNWRARRQTAYLSIVFGIIILMVFLIALPRLTRAPDCSDGKKNGAETGVDCGGMCERACLAETKDIEVLWARAFPVSEEIWNAAAYLENQNIGLAVKSLRYRFRFYDRENIFIGEKTGRTFLPPNGRSVIFEASIDMGSRVPYLTVLEIQTSSLEWLKLTSEQQNILNKISILDKVLDDSSGLPQLSARVNNSSVYNVKDVEVSALIYDSEGKVLSVSRTIIDRLPANKSEPVFFSWPQPLSGPAVQIEILTKIDTLDLNL